MMCECACHTRNLQKLREARPKSSRVMPLFRDSNISTYPYFCVTAMLVGILLTISDNSNLSMKIIAPLSLSIDKVHNLMYLFLKD